jgi:hypothetical protein
MKKEFTEIDFVFRLKKFIKRFLDYDL